MFQLLFRLCDLKEIDNSITITFHVANSRKLFISYELLTPNLFSFFLVSVISMVCIIFYFILHAPLKAYDLQEQGRLMELVDPNLGSSYSTLEAMRMLRLALLCTNTSPTHRPSMSLVVSMLEGKTPIQAPLINRGESGHHARLKASDLLSEDSQPLDSSTFSHESIDQRHGSSNGPWAPPP